jgi:hypothetical protein
VVEVAWAPEVLVTSDSTEVVVALSHPGAAMVSASKDERKSAVRMQSTLFPSLPVASTSDTLRPGIRKRPAVAARGSSYADSMTTAVPYASTSVMLLPRSVGS